MKDVETKNKSSREQLCEVVKKAGPFFALIKEQERIMITKRAGWRGIDAGIIFPAGETSSCGTWQRASGTGPVYDGTRCGSRRKNIAVFFPVVLMSECCWQAE